MMWHNDLPVREACLSGFVNAANLMAQMQLGVYAVKLVEHITGNPQTNGTIVGAANSAFYSLEFVASVAWGTLCDRWSSKRVMVLGALAISLSTALFGVASSVWAAITIRAVSGAAAAATVGTKAFLGRSAEERNQNQAFVLQDVVTIPALIVSPLLGGWLYDPTERFAWLEDSVAFSRFPQLLSCLVAAAVSLLVAVLVWWCLDDDRGRVVVDSFGTTEKEEEHGDTERLSAVWRVWSVRWLCVLHFLDGWVLIGWSIVLTTWMFASEATGGWDMSVWDFSVVTSVSFIGKIATSAVFDAYVRKVSIRRAYQSYWLPIAVAVFVWPFLAQVQGTTARNVTFGVMQTIITIPALTIDGSAFNVLATNAVPGSQLGVAQGLTSGAYSLGKVMSFCFPVLHDWAMANLQGYGKFAAFHVLGGMMCVGAMLSLWLPYSINHRVCVVLCDDDSDDDGHGRELGGLI